MLRIDITSDRKYLPNPEDFLLGQRECYVIFLRYFFDEIHSLTSFDYPNVLDIYDTIV